MNRLLEIGFEAVGHWQLVEDELTFELRRHGSQQDILYAFVSDGAVKYVGKTLQTLAKRLYGYRNPEPSQSTNCKNNKQIKELLRSGAAVDILALPDNGLLHYGQFHVNLAAGLEDDIVSVVQPEWNGRPKNLVPTADTAPAGQLVVVDSFSFTLQKTYFWKGFFNVPVKHAQPFGADREEIDVFCGNAAVPIIGVINRRCNKTNAPRIIGGPALRQWFQENAAMKEKVDVLVLSPNEIRLSIGGNNLT